MPLTGMKNTRQRQLLLELFHNTGRSLTAEEIFASPSIRSARMALSTIYRNLDQLSGRGVLVKTLFPDGLSRYELAGEHAHHHYLVCTHCQKRQTFDECPLKRMQSDLEKQTGFQITGHNLMLYGLCRECQQEMAANA